MKSKIIIPIVFAICIASGSIVFYKKANHKTNPIIEANLDVLTDNEGDPFVLPCIESETDICRVEIEYADGTLHFLKIHNAKHS